MTAPVNVICMKWRTRYSADYVNRLRAGVARNLRRPHRFVCFTDDPTGIDPGIETHALPPIALPEAMTWTPWRKLSVWQHPLADLAGDTLFLDLDLVIVGPLDPLFDVAPGKFCVIENWTQLGEAVGNTSVFRFLPGAHPAVFDRFAADPAAIIEAFRIEQHYVSTMLPDQHFWPRDWCVSFKHNLVPHFPQNWRRAPELGPGNRIVVFTGRPDIDEAARGEWPAPWHKRWYKHCRPAAFIPEHWPLPGPPGEASAPKPERPPISCYIRTKNEVGEIAATVRAAARIAQEVIVVDSESTDGTPAAAAEAGARVVNMPWRGNGAQKFAAEALCEHDWLIDLDADETITSELAAEIMGLFATGAPAHDAYIIPVCHTSPIDRRRIIGRDWRVKLYDRRKARAPDSALYSNVELGPGARTATLKGGILHALFDDATDLMTKMNRRSSRNAKLGKKKPLLLTRLRIVFGLPFYLFKNAVLRGMIGGGTYGFSAAMMLAIGRWLRDVKMYEAARGLNTHGEDT